MTLEPLSKYENLHFGNVLDIRTSSENHEESGYILKIGFANHRVFHILGEVG